MMYLLRYNSRHHVWFPRGYEGRWLPQLNPISSIYDSKWRPSLHEPLWMMRLRHRLFAYAGRQRCGRRDDAFALNHRDGPMPDTWDLGPDGMRTCSYCGSIHPDDLMTICRRSLTDERYGVEGTTKGYKVYVRQPGVRNASEGAIKFYMQHAPRNPSAEDRDLFSAALRISGERFRAMYDRKSVA